MMQIYNFKFDGLRVNMPDMPRHKWFLWKRIIGISIGSWFFGCIKGDYRPDVANKQTESEV